MKKLKLILYLLCLLSIVSLTSCNKVSEFNKQDYGKIKYYVAGLYIQVNDYDEYSIDDPNPKVYFDFSQKDKFGMLSTKTGTLTSAVIYENLAKNVKKENEINQYYMNATIKFVNSDVNEVELYLIYIDNDGKFSVNEELSETVNVKSSSTYDFITSFTNNKEQYQIQMKLFFKK